LPFSDPLLPAGREGTISLPDPTRCGFDGSPLPVAAADLDNGLLVCANDAAAALYGLAPAKLVGRSLTDLSCPHTSAVGVREAFAALALAPGSTSFGWSQRRPDGTPWRAEIRIIRVDPGPPRRLLFTLQDVTARWRADLARQQLVRHPELSTRLGRPVHWEIWPLEGRIFFDPELPQLMGYAPHELSENLADWVATVPESDRARVAAMLQAVIDGRSDRYAIEHPVVHKDGTIGWVYVHGERVSAPGETPLRVVGSSVDITARKRFERDLELSQFAVEHSPNAMFWIDGRGCVSRANQQACRSLGVTLDELRGRPVWSFDPDFSAERWAPTLAELQRRGSIVFETRHRRADGSVFPVEITASHVPVGGQDFGFCIARDITERKRAEQSLRELNEALERRVQERTAAVELQARRNELILGAAIDGFFAADMNGRIVDANPAYCELLGYTRDELLERSIPDIEAIESAADVTEHIAKVRALGHDRFDTRHRRKDGRLVEVEVSVSEVMLASAPLMFAFVRDIGERKRSELALRQAKDEAERANLAKSEFLSRMSHELRTPLNAILGFGQLLGLKVADPRQAAHVREIISAGRHLLTLIDEVLDLARVESGHLTVSPEPVAVAPLVKECQALLRPQAEARGVRMGDPAPSCHAHVLADRTRLKQVLLNLLSNAIKYNRDGGSVAVSCAATSAPALLDIRVSDTGPGLTAGQRARLFVPFERLDAEERQIQGTGIGLALSRRLVEVMGGAIGVESEPGAGSSFWVRLPLAQPQREALGPTSSTTAPTEQAQPSGTAHEILCIEDNPANLRLIESIFAGRSDIRLLTAIAPGLGLELARVHRPDLILLDINLPDMDGYAVMQCLRENDATRGIPVIAVSANAMPRDLERAKAAGFAAYLTKPLDIAGLLALVEQTLPRA
jgi:PAS domain S-box-containing protein